MRFWPHFIILKLRKQSFLQEPIHSIGSKYEGQMQMFVIPIFLVWMSWFLNLEPVQHYPSIMSPEQYFPSMRQPVQHCPSIILEKSHIECFILNLWKYENLWVLVFVLILLLEISGKSLKMVYFNPTFNFLRCRNDVLTSASYLWARPSSRFHRTCRWRPPFLWHSLPTAFWTSWVNLMFDKIFSIFISTIC